MQPSLAYIDVRTGDVIALVMLADELHRLSIRHLVVDAHGTVWFGCQYTGSDGRQPALVGSHRRGGKPALFPGSPPTLRALKNYVGSLALDSTGTILAASSPVGGLVTYW